MKNNKNVYLISAIILIIIAIIGASAYFYSEYEKATGIVESAYTKEGKNYIEIDYITFRHEAGDMPWGTTVNDSDEIRTIEVSQNAAIKLRNKMVNGIMTTGDYSVGFEEFKNIFNTPNDFRKLNPWDISIKNGIIFEIIENFRS